MSKFKCPECGNDELVIHQITAHMMNTDKYLCTTMRTDDPKATVWCPRCDWEGVRSDVDNEKEKQ